jgi:hypothetical protein
MGIWLTQSEDFSNTVVSTQRLLRTTENAVLLGRKMASLFLFRAKAGRRTYGEWMRTAVTQSR